MHAVARPSDRPRATTQSPIYGAITQNRIRSNKGRNRERGDRGETGKGDRDASPENYYGDDVAVGMQFISDI